VREREREIKVLLDLFPTNKKRKRRKKKTVTKEDYQILIKLKIIYKTRYNKIKTPKHVTG
jgi:hypothetical protein